MHKNKIRSACGVRSVAHSSRQRSGKIRTAFSSLHPNLLPEQDRFRLRVSVSPSHRFHRSNHSLLGFLDTSRRLDECRFGLSRSHANRLALLFSVPSRAISCVSSLKTPFAHCQPSQQPCNVSVPFVKLLDRIPCHASERGLSERFRLLFRQTVHFPLQPTNDLDSDGNSFRHTRLNLSLETVHWSERCS